MQGVFKGVLTVLLLLLHWKLVHQHSCVALCVKGCGMVVSVGRRKPVIEHCTWAEWQSILHLAVLEAALLLGTVWVKLQMVWHLGWHQVLLPCYCACCCLCCVEALVV